MKRFSAIILALLMLLAFAGCNKKENTSLQSDTVSTVSETTDFKKPENYAAVISASINPHINLYIDINGKVLAVEAVNEDAKEIIADIATENADYLTVIKAFINAANAKNFVKGDAELRLGIAEKREADLNTDDMLSKAGEAAQQTVTELNITLKVVLPGTAGDNAENTASADNTPAPGTNNTTVNNNNNNNNNRQTAAHTHNYSKATCTAPERCACGATRGAALGHSWVNATCKAPKTCKTCGATEGAKGSHSYSNGKCTVCGASEFLNPKTALTKGVEYFGNSATVNGSDLTVPAVIIDIQSDGTEVCDILDRMYEKGGSDVYYNGVGYKSLGAAENPHFCEITDTEIIVYNLLWEEKSNTVTMRLVLQSDGMLRVKYSTNSFFPVGLVLSKNINEVLK